MGLIEGVCLHVEVYCCICCIGGLRWLFRLFGFDGAVFSRLGGLSALWVFFVELL